MTCPLYRGWCKLFQLWTLTSRPTAAGELASVLKLDVSAAAECLGR